MNGCVVCCCRDTSDGGRHAHTDGKHACTDRPDRLDHPGSLPSSAYNDSEQQPHIPRRKRSKPVELLRPLQVLAAANAAAAARLAHDAHVTQDDYTSDPLSFLAAAAAAESESEAELAKSPERTKQVRKPLSNCSAML